MVGGDLWTTVRLSVSSSDTMIGNENETRIASLTCS